MSEEEKEPIRVLEKYEIIRRIAQGGMGEIFLSRQVGVAGFNRLVILKTLLPELAEDEDLRAAFLNEARIGATLNHPNIVAIYEIGEWESVYFLAMEFVNGGGLDGIQRAAYKKKVGIPRVVSGMIVRDAALGLDHAHAAKDHEGNPLGIVHRDCTPQNLMVRLDGVVKVVDFGIAKAAGSDNRTNAGEVKGKLAYLAPEQIKGEPLDGRCDQFALGVVFWELITGRRLFNAPNPIDIFKKILAHDIPPPSTLDPSVPPEVEKIVMRMLAQDRDARYRRMGDAAREIGSWVESVGGTTDQLSLFVKEMIGDQTSERTRDLTPTAVKIQGLVRRERVPCVGCGAQNQSKARFCAECGVSMEATGEASRRMIAAATGQAPFAKAEALIPASVDALLDGPMPLPQGLTPLGVRVPTPDKSADPRLTMDELFSFGSGAMPVAPGPAPKPAAAAGAPAPAAGPAAGSNPFVAQGFPPVVEGAGRFPPSPRAPAEAASEPALEVGFVQSGVTPPGASAFEATADPNAWVGRREILLEVGKMVREVASGRITGLVLAGDHGSGRSATLAKCATLAAAARLRVVRAAGRHFGPRRPLDVVIQLLAGLAGVRPQQSTEILQHVQTLGLGRASSKRLETVLGGERSPEVLFGQSSHLAFFSDLMAVFLEEAQRSGLCLVVDDLHWADAPSRRVLDGLVSNKASAPLAVLASAALRFDTAQVPRLELGPLLDAEIQQLIDNHLGQGGLPSNAGAAVVGKARGNPGFALDLLEVLRFEGAVHNMSGQWVTTDNFDGLQLPPNPTFFIMNRLRALSAAGQSLIKTAAAVGAEFRTEFVTVAMRQGNDIKAAIGECVAAQLIEQTEHGVYRFTRSIYIDVASMMCEGSEERELHQRLYKAMATLVDDREHAAEAAGHLLQCESIGLLAQGSLGPSVARRLDQCGHLPEAARMWTATLQGAIDEGRASANDDADAAEILHLAAEGVAVIARHSASDAIHVAGRVLDAVPASLAPRARAQLLLERARGLATRLRREQAEQDLDVALELLPEDGDQELRSALLAELGRIMGRAGDWAGAALQLETCVRSMSADQSDVAERMTELAVAYSRVQQMEKAMFAISKARELADKGGAPEPRTVALLGQAAVLAAAQDAAGARQCVEAVQKIAQAQGDVGALVRCHLTLMDVERLLGEDRRAEEQRQRALALASSIGWKQAVLEAGASAGA